MAGGKRKTKEKATAEAEANARAGARLRTWRLDREMTQAALGEAVGTTANTISQFETGERGLSPYWFERLAHALGTTIGHLAEHDPADVKTDVFRAARDVPAARRGEAVKLLRILGDGS